MTIRRLPRPPQGGSAEPARPARQSSVRIFISNPVTPTRWSQPVSVAKIEAAARTTSASVVSLDEAATRRAEVKPLAAGGQPVVIVAGTLDTKGEELRFMRDLLKQADVRTRLVDLSTSGKHSAADVSPIEIALNHPRGSSGVFSGDRGASVAAMAEAFEIWTQRQTNIAGIISAGGSGATSLVTPAMRRLPVGVPKIMISTVASGDVGRYVGPADIMMMYSVTDVAGPQLDLARRCSATARRRWPGWSRRALPRRARPAVAVLCRTRCRQLGSRCSASRRLRAAAHAPRCRATTNVSCSTPPASVASRWRSWSMAASSPASSTSRPPRSAT